MYDATDLYLVHLLGSFACSLTYGRAEHDTEFIQGVLPYWRGIFLSRGELFFSSPTPALVGTFSREEELCFSHGHLVSRCV